MVYSAFVLNYFDKGYVKFVLINFALSAVLDLVWLFVLAGVFFTLIQDYWDPKP